MCMPECLPVGYIPMSAGVPWMPEGLDSLGAEVTGSYELPGLGARN